MRVLNVLQQDASVPNRVERWSWKSLLPFPWVEYSCAKKLIKSPRDTYLRHTASIQCRARGKDCALPKRSKRKGVINRMINENFNSMLRRELKCQLHETGQIINHQFLPILTLLSSAYFHLAGAVIFPFLFNPLWLTLRLIIQRNA